MSLGTKLKRSEKVRSISGTANGKTMCLKQAVTKWGERPRLPGCGEFESDRITFDVSVDYLIADGTTLIGKNIKENIDLSAYEKSSKRVV